MIHEIDKTARGVNDGYRVELMSSIMSIIERGSIVKANVVGGNNILNLENVLVLFDGCFDGIEKIAGRRVGMNAMGFNHSQSCIETDLRSMITKSRLGEIWNDDRICRPHRKPYLPQQHEPKTDARHTHS